MQVKGYVLFLAVNLEMNDCGDSGWLRPLEQRENPAAPWPKARWCCQNGDLGHYLANRKHGEREKLGAYSPRSFAKSGRARRRLATLDGGRELPT